MQYYTRDVLIAFHLPSKNTVKLCDNLERKWWKLGSDFWNWYCFREVGQSLLLVFIMSHQFRVGSLVSLDSGRDSLEKRTENIRFLWWYICLHFYLKLFFLSINLLAAWHWCLFNLLVCNTHSIWSFVCFLCVLFHSVELRGKRLKFLQKHLEEK